MEEVSFEGYGPGGIAVIVESMTDNNNRTVAEVRHAFTKSGGNLGTNGSVSYLFEKKGIITVSANQDTDQITTVQVVTAVQRNGDKYLKAVVSKRLSEQQIEKALDGKLVEGTTLITDKHPSYKAFANTNPTIKHKALLAKDHVDKNDSTIHLQKVNNVHAQLRKFLSPFNGVSSKYIQNYLNWYASIDKIKSSKKTLMQWFMAMMLTDQAYSLVELFKQNNVLIRT